MIAIERLVLAATSADERTLHPPGDEERIVDRLDKLVGRMAHMENDKKRGMDACDYMFPKTAGDDSWDPQKSLLASKEMHELMNSRCFLQFLMALRFTDFG